NSYLWEWLPHKQTYLSVMLDMEAPPTPRVCISCGGDGIYRCTDCAHQPVFCMACCRNQHTLQPFHCVQQWNATFFKDSSLRLARLVLHLGHGGEPCP
ncbi:hypothetical protein SCLCIDRAFT_41012, partial [Scleroderma citrinum Foug A]